MAIQSAPLRAQPLARSRRGARILFVGATVMAALVLLPGVGAAAGLVVRDADNGKTVTLVAGTTLSITLVSNITTGYQWVVLTAPDAKVVRLASGTGRYTAPSSSAIGAAGSQTFVVRSVAPGTTKIALGYKRANDTTASKTYALDITVLGTTGLPATSTLAGRSSEAPNGGPLVLAFGAGVLGFLILRRRVSIRLVARPTRMPPWRAGWRTS